MDQITVEQALSMLAEIFEEPEENLQINTPRDDVLGWDSLGVLTLMAEFDERFNITIPSEDLESFLVIGDLINFLKENGIVGKE
jgi:acyl carrier protein